MGTARAAFAATYSTVEVWGDSVELRCHAWTFAERSAHHCKPSLAHAHGRVTKVPFSRHGARGIGHPSNTAVFSDAGSSCRYIRPSSPSAPPMRASKCSWLLRWVVSQVSRFAAQNRIFPLSRNEYPRTRCTFMPREQDAVTLP